MTEEDTISLNLDFDNEEAETSIKDGISAGIKKGLKKGAADEMVPLAQKAGEMAIKQLTGGSPIDSTLNTVRKTVELQALQSTLESMKNKNTAQPQQQSIQPSQDLMTTLSQLKQFGIDPNEFIKKIGANNLVAMMNPKLAPMLSLIGNNQQPNQQSQGNDMTPLLMMMMNKNNQPNQPTQPITNGNDAILTMMVTMMQQSQQSMAQIFKMQQENAELQRQNLMERMSPYMQPAPSFVDQLQKMKAQFSGLKEIGIMGENHQKGDREIDLDFEAKKMAMGIERDKMDFQRQLQVMEQQNQQKKEETNMYMKMLETGQNIIKNLKLEISPKKLGIKPTTDNDEEPYLEKTPVEEESEALTERISSRISSMLRIPTNPK